MANIGIVGAGMAGVHLGLDLLRRGLVPTLYAERTPDEMRKANLPNTAAFFGTLLAGDKAIGVNHWDTPDYRTHQIDFGVKGAPALAFRADISPPAQFMDMRLYVPKLLEDFAERGGRVITSGPLEAERVAELGRSHDLMIVASGRGSLAGMFPRIPERSPYTEPQRRLFAGLFRGISFPDPFRFTFQIIPGHGEMFENQYLTFGGPVNGLLLEAVPGGSLEAITRMRYEDDPSAFNAAMLAILRDDVPAVYDRIEDKSAFGALGPRDLLQGSIVPVVRRGYAEIGPGRFALAVGDAHVTHDPILGQGANAASRAARKLGELLAARIEQGGALDGAFCADTEEQLWVLTQPVAEWSNAFLMPPPPHAIGLLAAAAANNAIAQAFVRNFDDPRRQWDVLKSPESTAAFIGSFSAP
jgi:hypothetical protein